MFLSHIDAFTALIIIAGLTVPIYCAWKLLFYRGDDCSVTEDGLTVRYCFGLLRFRTTFRQIESIQLLPFADFLFSRLYLQCVMSGLWAISRWPSHVVVVRRKRGVTFEYLVITPRDAPAFVERLQKEVTG